jgi:hypothetical protein
MRNIQEGFEGRSQTKLDHFRKARLQLRKAGGPNKENNEIYRSLTAEELAVVRTWADRSLKDAYSAASVLTDEDLRCAIRLLHKGEETSDKPSDWRPIGLFNVGTQLVHHVINYRPTTITEVENLIVPGQDGGRSGRGVDLNHLKLDWITSEANRLKQRIIRIDIDFKNAFNSMSQSALWEVMRAYNIPDVDLLEAIYVSNPNEDPADCSSAEPRTILSRMRCSEWAVVSRSLSHADGPLWAALLKTFRCDDACLRRLLSSFDACCSPGPL